MNATGNLISARRTARRAMSLAEVMISLTICSLLLVAVATAYNASAAAVDANDQFFRATQAGRVSLNQMLTEIRRAHAVDQPVVAGTTTPDLKCFEVIRPEDNRTVNEISRVYRYDPAAKKITLQISYAGGAQGRLYTLASNVEACTFGPAAWGKDANNTDAVVRLAVALDVKVGGNSVRLNGSSGPRRAAKQ